MHQQPRIEADRFPNQQTHARIDPHRHAMWRGQVVSQALDLSANGLPDTHRPLNTSTKSALLEHLAPELELCHKSTKLAQLAVHLIFHVTKSVVNASECESVRKQVLIINVWQVVVRPCGGVATMWTNSLMRHRPRPKARASLPLYLRRMREPFAIVSMLL